MGQNVKKSQGSYNTKLVIEAFLSCVVNHGKKHGKHKSVCHISLASVFGVLYKSGGFEKPFFSQPFCCKKKGYYYSIEQSKVVTQFSRRNFCRWLTLLSTQADYYLHSLSSRSCQCRDVLTYRRSSFWRRRMKGTFYVTILFFPPFCITTLCLKYEREKKPFL